MILLGLQLMVGLLSYNFGMLFSGILLEMDTSTTYVAWIYSFGLIISCIVSAFLMPLVAVFGLRKVALAFGTIYSLALIMSAFSTTAEFLFFSSVAAGNCKQNVALINLMYSA